MWSFWDQEKQIDNNIQIYFILNLLLMTYLGTWSMWSHNPNDNIIRDPIQGVFLLIQCKLLNGIIDNVIIWLLS